MSGPQEWYVHTRGVGLTCLSVEVGSRTSSGLVRILDPVDDQAGYVTRL
jgi:hypothetical protein